MTPVPSWRRYLTFWRTPVLQDVDDELRFHTNMRVREYMARGMSEAEARTAVTERLGNIDAAHSECVELSEVRVRNARNAAFFDALRSDLRYAIRGLRARPGFAAAIIMTLGLGIGANATVFSVVDRLLFRTAPMLREANRTHRIYVSYPLPSGDGAFTLGEMPFVRYKQLSETSGSFTRLAAYGASHSVVGAAEEGRDMQVAGVSPGFFAFFDAPPVLGRYFSSREDLPPTGEPVVVLSYGMWQTEFGGRADALGAKMPMGSTTYTVIGVTPRGFVGLWPDEPPVAYLPFSAFGSSMNYAGRGDTWWTATGLNIAGVLATRRPGVSVEAATTDLTNQIRRRWSDANNENDPIRGAAAIVGSTITERGPQTSEIARVAALVGAMGLVVMLIAGANVANLLLARALRRRREIALRVALGISRRRLMAQLITETLLLAAFGGVAGLVVARWGGPLLRAKFVATTTETSVLADMRTLILVGLAVVVAGVATGLAPAWQAGRLDVTRFLRIGARDGTLQRSRLRASLLVIQSALSVLLLIGAGLFVRSIDKARHLHMGYDVDKLLIVKLNMRGVRLDSARSEDLWRRIADGAHTVAAVERSAVALGIPLTDLVIADVKRPPEMDSVQFSHLFLLRNVVAPGFFTTMGTRILRGRAIDPTDVAGSTPAVVVSDRFARTFWPGKDALGQCVLDLRGICRYVVGIAEDIRNGWTNDDTALEVYTAAAQSRFRNRTMFVRTREPAAAYADQLRAVLQREMPGASFVTVTPYADVIGNAMKSWQLGATVFMAFGLLAMLLASIGLYSAISYNVTQRTHEMGVRRALGARGADVIRLVMQQGVLLGGVGVMLGAVLAYLTAGRIEPLLFQISPRDPFVYGFVIVAMFAIAVVASFVPARRAATVDPNVALRSE